ncbi:acyltransferase [Alginatibacterium sediminis]|uniref:Acyltransferase n=1 Tax=Alginatibacterium sediminis TaxID=2164068 RepID=A0A420E855_9ALTE|nr:acyltransferase [Alginatibacterium sediminis]RKF15494.1 acyltransferase [Alginatibacterium sediminis]
MPDYQRQHKKRLAWMPWLYYSLKPKHHVWAKQWQQQLQVELAELESVEFANNCFLAPSAELFAEPGRLISIGENSFIAADCFIHGPVTIGANVAINHQCSFDGGRAGIVIGDDTRIANNVKIYAFNHGLSPSKPIWQQNNTSLGVTIGKDVWIGAGVGIVDGLEISDHSVVAMGAVVTKPVPPWAIVAGNPAKIIGDRRKKPLLHQFPSNRL